MPSGAAMPRRPPGPACAVAPGGTCATGGPTTCGRHRGAATPTFVLLHGEQEVGRILGYVDGPNFWRQLQALMMAGAGRLEDTSPQRACPRHGMNARHGRAITPIGIAIQADQPPLLEPRPDHRIQAGPQAGGQPEGIRGTADRGQQESTAVERVPDIAVQPVRMQRLRTAPSGTSAVPAKRRRS